MWQEKLAPLVEDGKVAVLGVVQEQHVDRVQLYKQWRNLNWPIAIDALNTLGLRAVPIPMGLDAAGVVRAQRLDLRNFEESFVQAEFDEEPSWSHNRARRPNVEDAARAVSTLVGQGGAGKTTDQPSAVELRRHGDALFLFGGDERLSLAVTAYTLAANAAPDDPLIQFRRGVALLARAESARRRDGDSQEAIAAWGRALALVPGQYIWRRRIQQYGPRLAKPYNFYFWVDEARRAIRARGDAPEELRVEPSGSEIASPRRGERAADDGSSTPVESAARKALSGARAVPIDKDKHVAIEATVVPARVRPGGRVRVRLTLRLQGESKPEWNDEAQGVEIVPTSQQFVLEDRDVPSALTKRAPRIVEFEGKVALTTAGRVSVHFDASYDVCLNQNGVCVRLRQEVVVPIIVDAKAPKID